MKPIIIIMVLIAAILILPACNNKTSTGDVESNMNTQAITYTNISVKEAKARLETEKGIILLDVRTKEEYAEKHIPNSMLIPLDAIEKEAPGKFTDKNATIFVYCRSGKRSVTASKALVGIGYTNIYNLGGIIDWPYETESGE
jgi:phage shock protein E